MIHRGGQSWSTHPEPELGFPGCLLLFLPFPGHPSSLREALIPASACHSLAVDPPQLQQDFLQLCRMETACVYSKTETSKTCWSNRALPLNRDQADTQVDFQEIPASSPHASTEIHVTGKEQILWDAQGLVSPSLPHTISFVLL